MIKTHNISKFISASSFTTTDAYNEFFLTANVQPDTSFEKALDNLYSNYKKVLKKLGLDADTQVFCRFYLSDISNQKDFLLSSKIYNFCKNGACSVVQQCPLGVGSLSLLVYHITSKNKIKGRKILKFDDEDWRNGVKIEGKNYDIFCTANFSGFGSLDSFEQTNEIFDSYNTFLNNNDMTLIKNVVRTWLYVRDIDNHYQGMVDSRREYFAEQGLTKETRFIASTGIEGKLKEVNSLVSMDALALTGLNPEQIIRMEALENLNPTHEYGVTFERGSKIEFGDRAHLYISGTASIDKHGQVMHTSDIKKQTKRVLENIAALLRPHKAGLLDMAYFIVYLRNITEIEKVKEVMVQEKLDHTPTIFVEGAVCRPAWLVEMEGIAIIPEASSYPPFI